MGEMRGVNMKVYSLLDEDIDEYGKYGKDKPLEPKPEEYTAKLNADELYELKEKIRGFNGDTIKYKYNNKQITIYQIKTQKLLRIDVREKGD